METHCKLLFEEEYDENEIIKETLWASVVGENQYCIDNIPFYVSSVALSDVFSAKEQDGFLVAEDLINASGNSTIRILFDDIAIVQETRTILEQNYGCESELSNVPNLISVNVPVTVDYKGVKLFLQNGEKLHKWEYEEGCLSEEHRTFLI